MTGEGLIITIFTTAVFAVALCRLRGIIVAQA